MAASDNWIVIAGTSAATGIIAFAAGMMVANADTSASPAIAAASADVMSDSMFVEDESEPVSAAEFARIRDAIGDAAERAADGVTADSGTTIAPHIDASVESQQQMNMRQIAEMLELSCRETGVNCEYARMARRHYNERYGR